MRLTMSTKNRYGIGLAHAKKTAKSFVRGAGGETSRWFLRVWRDAGFIGKA